MTLGIIKVSIRFCIIILFLSFITKVYSSQINYAQKKNGDCADLSFNEIDLIEVNVKKNKKFTKKIIRSVLKQVIYPKDKKNFKSEIIFYNKNELPCKIVSKLRINGDYADHVAIEKGNPISSMNIKLIKSNMGGIVSFKLYIPRTRNYFNEIFITTFLRNIGLLAPRTKIVNVKFNGSYHSMILQENIVKEFLENNRLTESFIFEGDDKNIQSRLGGNPSIQRLAKITNSQIAIKNNDMLDYAFISLSELNQIYLKNNLYKFNQNKKGKINEKLFFKNNTKHPNYKSYTEKNSIFETFMIALDSEHGLSQEDRKFYYDPFFKNFLPIYYDGGSSLFYPNEKVGPNQKFNMLNGRGFKLQSNGYDLSTKKMIAENLCINKCLKILVNINKKKLLNELHTAGMLIEPMELNQVLNLIKKRIQELTSSDIVKLKDYNESYYSSFNYPQKINLVFADQNNNLFYCPPVFIKNLDCKKDNSIILNDEDKMKLLEQKYSIDNMDSYFITNNSRAYYDGNKTYLYNNKNYKDLKEIEVDNFNIIFNKYSSVEIDKVKKNITLTSNSISQRFIIYGKEINNWKFYYVENFNTPGKHKSDLTTGCVTFLDTKVTASALISKKSSCEDTFNLIRVKGDFNDINIKNSYADALDADFSKIKFKNITISNAGNDCLDFSYGNYEIMNAVISDCKDKGLSLGENSRLEAHKLQISKSKTGAAIKDSSQANFFNLKISNTNTCIAAYNKKKEFFGGKVFVNNDNLECNDSIKQFNIDKLSNISTINQTTQ